MFGGGGLNPRKLQQMMEQMGIDVTEIDATTVRIETADGDALVFDNPDVTRMDAQGQQTYQIVGDPETVEVDADAVADSEAEASEDQSAGGAEIPDEDVSIVSQRTGVPEDEARTALEATDGDLAAAIDRLT